MSDLKSLCGNLAFERICRARLQAGTVDSSTCSPKGERYRGPAPSSHTDSIGPTSGVAIQRGNEVLPGSGPNAAVKDIAFGSSSAVR